MLPLHQRNGYATEAQSLEMGKVPANYIIPDVFEHPGV